MNLVLPFLQVHFFRGVIQRLLNSADLINQPDILPLLRGEDSAASDVVDVADLLRARGHDALRELIVCGFHPTRDHFPLSLSERLTRAEEVCVAALGKRFGIETELGIEVFPNELSADDTDGA